MRLSPNGITLSALPLSLFAFWFLLRGAFLAAFFLGVGVSLCDFLDGYTAKKRGRITPFGAFLDSATDRVTELIFYAGILFFYLKEGRLLLAGAAYWAIGSAMLVSYTRARAENFIENCRVGFWERPERLILLLLGLLANRLPVVLWILAVGGTLTLIHRIRHTRRLLQNTPPPSLFEKILFWDFPRQSWPYRLYVLLVVVLTFFL